MVIAVDLGGTNIRVAEVSGKRIRGEQKVRTPKKKREILKAIFDLVGQYSREPIGISSAGVEISGRIVWALNMDFDNVPLKAMLKKEFGVRVEVENDANCAGLAELHYGAGKGKKNFVMLTLGTGIGGAVIIDGKLYKGRGAAGEPGSMLMKGDIYEHLASGSAQSLLAKKHGFSEIGHLELQRLAERGDARARKVFEELGENLGVGIKNIIYLLDPEMIVLGGGFSRVKLYWPAMMKVVNENCVGGRKTPIVRAKFGDGAGLIGAGILVEKR